MTDDFNGEKQKQKELLEFYSSLSPEERKDRILLDHAFRDLYNEIIDARRVSIVPMYFWEKWAPILGPLPTVLYVRMRQYGFNDQKTGEQRNVIWPKQSTLCTDVGIRDRKYLRKALRTLEHYGFITAEDTYYRDPTTGQARRGNKKYSVWFEIPLIDEDAAELMIRYSTGAEPAKSSHRKGFTYKGAKRPYISDSVENPALKGVSHPFTDGRETPSITSTRSSTTNVNVLQKTSLSNDDTREKAEYLASLMAERLGDQKSYRFFVLVAGVLPENVIYQLLSEADDADHRGLIKTTKGQYFTDQAKREAKNLGRDLSPRKKSSRGRGKNS